MFHLPCDTIPQDWLRLRTYLASHGFILDQTEPRQFAGGFGNLNYLIGVNGVPSVLRRPPAGTLPPGANDMAREHRVLSSLHPAFPLAPGAIHFCGDAAVLGAPFFIMEYREGHVFHENSLPENADANFARILSERVVEVLADLHRLDPDANGLGNLGRPDGFVERTLVGWHKRAGMVDAGRDRVGLDQIYDWLLRNREADTAPVLIHNDFKLNNMIFDRAELTRPVAVLDWDMATRGSALFDFATLLAYWVEPADPTPVVQLGQMPSAAWPGFMSRAQAISLYQKLTGCKLDTLPFFYVLALYKFAVVLLQLHAKSAQEERAGYGAPKHDWVAIASASIANTVQLIESGFRGW